MARTDWFEHDRFGMFVHWGLYSIPAGIWKGKRMKHPYSEWIQGAERLPRGEYRALASQFDPVNFDADAWMQEVSNAGMRYFLITSKHHDGFALWPTKASKYNIMDETSFGRDILGELSVAAKKYDVKLGFYYSHWQDWEGTGGDICSVYMENEEYVHPTPEQFEKYWQDKALVQVRELMENYAPAFLWFDTWSDQSFAYVTPKRQDELIDLIRGIDENCLINSRIQFLAPSDRIDFISTMDNTFPDEGFEKPWETSGTLNDSWGFHQCDYDWKSSEQLVKYLVGNASLGGNYQLNVGPTADGRFQDAAIRRLREIGTWMDVNSESIYGTKAGVLGAQPWGRSTMRHNANATEQHYLHLWDFTPGAAIHVPLTDRRLIRAYVLETGQELDATMGTDGIWIKTPKTMAGLGLPVIVLNVNAA